MDDDLLAAPVPVVRDLLAAMRAPRPLEARFSSLWSAGDVTSLRRPCVAIVGTRAASALGKSVARAMARTLAEAGCCILSGLATGIDAAAHEGALDAGGPTIGILGGGHRRFFPSRNRALAARMIAAGGAVLSPFPPDHPAHPPQFLQRNGIVAALADAVVIVEAPLRSGALNTAGWAAGRIPVLAVPGDVDRALAAGCNALIRDGAVLARDARDVLEALDLPAPLRLGPDAAESLPVPIDDLTAARLVRLLTDGEGDADTLAAQAGLSVEEVLRVLALLELDGRVEGRTGGRWALANDPPR